MSSRIPNDVLLKFQRKNIGFCEYNSSGDRNSNEWCSNQGAYVMTRESYEVCQQTERKFFYILCDKHFRLVYPMAILDENGLTL